jgi:hypothetical protein
MRNPIALSSSYIAQQPKPGTIALQPGTDALLHATPPAPPRPLLQRFELMDTRHAEKHASSIDVAQLLAPGGLRHIKAFLAQVCLSCSSSAMEVDFAAAQCGIAKQSADKVTVGPDAQA